MNSKLFPLLFAAILPIQLSSGAFVLLSDFDNLNTGTLAGQGGWTLSDLSTNTATVIADPTNSGNQVASVTQTGTNGQTVFVSLGSQAIANNTTSTLFFRFYTTSATPNFNLGLTDVAAPANGGYALNQAQFRVGFTDGQLDTRDGSNFQSLTTYSTSTWYNMWVVVDNAANTQTFYRSTGTDDATLIGTGAYTFRTGTTNSIQTLQLISNNATDSVLIDDIYIASGANTTLIPEPSSAALLSLAALGLLRRRK